MHLPQHIPSLPLPQRAARESGKVPDAGAALDDRDRASRPPIRALYIHTPFCVHKCHYCDFYSFVDTRDQQEAFASRLIGELDSLAPHAAGAPLRSVFVGGGTPSLLRVEIWHRLLIALAERFDLSAMGPGGAGEFTVECNPESATGELMAALAAGGVNRVSVGAQSFQPRHLRTLERWHDPENVGRALEAARAAGIRRRSADLIFAIPGQSLEDWDSDLERALALGTTHLSCYNLTYEPNTAMSKRLELGEFEPTPDELEAEMYEHTVRRLHAAGLGRYEVSNFAAPGEESIHNLAYWRQEQWLAAGPSASGHAWAGPDLRAGSHRWRNVPRLGDVLASRGYSPVVEHEAPDPLRLARERVMMGLRIAEGIDGAALLTDVGTVEPGRADALRRAVERCAGEGWMTVAADRWRLTDAGFLLADSVAAELMAAI